MPRRRRAAPTFLVAVVLGAGCGAGNQEATESVLDGRPRLPDVAGVVSSVTRQRIIVDGRSYPLRDDLESFSTYDGQLSSVFEREGQYVHVGLIDGDARWIAAIGLPRGEEDRVYFASELIAAKGDRLEFSGGTVLVLAEEVDRPPLGEVGAFIDVETDRVVEVTSVSASPGG